MYSFTHKPVSETMVLIAIGRGRVHAISYVTPFRLRSDVSIVCNSEVIGTSGSAAILTLTVENMSPIVALGKMLLSWCRADFWISNNVITETC